MDEVGAAGEAESARAAVEGVGVNGDILVLVADDRRVAREIGQRWFFEEARPVNSVLTDRDGKFLDVL